MGSRLETNSASVRKRIEKHQFEDEAGEEYEPSKFGGFSEYFRRKKIKLQNLDAEIRAASKDESKPAIFRGVVAHVNGYTQPSLNDLHVLIVSHGGGFMQYLDGKTTVTHIIASALTPKKKVELARYRIVKPAWVVDSIAAGKLLSWEAYRVIDEGPGQRLLAFENGQMVSQTNQNQSGYRTQTDQSWYTRQVEDLASELGNRDVEIAESGPASNKSKEEKNNSFSDSQLDDADLSEQANRLEHLADTNKYLTIEQPSYVEKDPSIGGPNLQELDVLPESLIDLDDPFETSQSPSTESRPPPAHIQQGESKKLSNELKAHPIELDDMRESGLASAQRSLEDCSTHISLDKEVDETKKDFSVMDHFDQEESRPMPPSERIKVADMTPEEHNALLLTDERVRKSTVVNPQFLKQYYEESRLHHLSAWKAALKSKLQAEALSRSSSQKVRDNFSRACPRRYILHVDFDCFFAAVSLIKYPQHKDKPVVIAHGAGAGAEIASCNYPAREYGIKNGMWMKHAQQKCSTLKVLPYDFPAYEAASREFYSAVLETGGIVQSVSVDEALLDISRQCCSSVNDNQDTSGDASITQEQICADEIARKLRGTIKERTGCSVSIGVGGNILLAKVALRKAKPAGQYQIRSDEVLEFIGNLQMQDLPGIAHSIGNRLAEIGIHQVKDVRQTSKEKIINLLGPKTGQKIWEYSRGIDRVPVGEQVVRKSVSAEVNWGIRFATQEQADEFIASLAEELSRRLIAEGVRGCQLTMKIMKRAADAPLDPPKHLGHGKCDTYSKSVVLGTGTCDAQIIKREALSILRGYSFTPGELRGLGLQMQKLEQLKGHGQSNGDNAHGSQKRLNFSSKTHTKLDHKSPEIQEEMSITEKHALSENRHRQIGSDADEIETPKKPDLESSHAIMAHHVRNIDNSESPTRPKFQTEALNIAGTQFILPSQADPEIVRALPEDIRKHLRSREDQLSSNMRAAKDSTNHNKVRDQGFLQDKSGQSKTSLATKQSADSQANDWMPSHSQIDPETLDALPADLQSEILAHYKTMPTKAQHKQAVLPQSPRTTRTVKLPRKIVTPTKKRRRAVDALNDPRRANTNPIGSCLMQSNFIAQAKAKLEAIEEASEKSNPETERLEAVSEEFLDALPDDIRREVTEQLRQDRLQKRGGINVPAAAQRRRRQFAASAISDQVTTNGTTLGGQQITLNLPVRATRPSFTPSRWTRISDLRKVIRDWYKSFQEDEPYEEDTKALISYLEDVIVQEKDLAKVESVVRWLRWCIDEDAYQGSPKANDNEGDILSATKHAPAGGWLRIVESIIQSVDGAVQGQGHSAINWS